MLGELLGPLSFSCTVLLIHSNHLCVLLNGPSGGGMVHLLPGVLFVGDSLSYLEHVFKLPTVTMCYLTAWYLPSCQNVWADALS